MRRCVFSKNDERIVATLRWCPFFTLALYAIWPAAFDLAVASLWTALPRAFVRDKMSEPLVASLGFFLAVQLYISLDMMDGPRRYRFDATPAEPCCVRLGGIPLFPKGWFTGQQPKQGVLALVIYLGLVYVFVQFRTPPPIEELPPSFARLVLEVPQIRRTEIYRIQ